MRALLVEVYWPIRPESTGRVGPAGVDRHLIVLDSLRRRASSQGSPRRAQDPWLGLQATGSIWRAAGAARFGRRLPTALASVVRAGTASFSRPLLLGQRLRPAQAEPASWSSPPLGVAACQSGESKTGSELGEERGPKAINPGRNLSPGGGDLLGRAVK